ncbi:hypothetical protein L1049_017011 [Liquidambar formosana]|uniref:Uncharacterized protein n=1 Tax=Liquidambar formosana TaxID=63359 RepID=A0AAP0S130_LIQFO
MEELVPPRSPGLPPVQLRECIEELLKFTLTSSINETLEIDLGLSKDYCSNLLKDDPHDPTSDTPDSFEGVPPYPLYKHLASALYQFISSGALCKMYNKPVLKTIDFELHVQEPFFSELKDGLKTVEGRCAMGEYNRMSTSYPSFSDLLEAESLARVLPGIKTIEEGVQIYRNFYTEEKERSNGVLAICVAKPASQPYISLANLLSGLSYGGVQSLLGLMHAAGTIPEALPPSRSTLLSSFMLPYNLNVKGSTLTHGARALAKHANRSCNNSWGSFDGSDSNKNRLAMDVINHLISHSCWLNVHIVPPNGAVFEIRVEGGYGARWSKDGTKFVGFLEPYMEDGHSKGWKH